AQFERQAHPLRALGDASGEHCLLVFEQGVKLPLRDVCPRSDLERAGPGIATLRESAERGAENALAQWLLQAWLGGTGSCRRARSSPLLFFHLDLLQWYRVVP